MALRKIGAFGAAMVMLAGLPQVAHAQDAAVPEAAPASCTFTTSDTVDIGAMLQRFGATIPDFDNFCARLNAANMGVESNGYTSTQLDTTSAIVLLRLYSLDSRVFSETNNYGFHNRGEVGDEITAQALSVAYNTSLSGIAEDLDSHIASVHAEAARLRALHQAGVTNAVSQPQETCQIFRRSMPMIEDLLRARGALPEIDDYDAFCENLRARGIGLWMAGDSRPVATGLQAWTSIALYDLATGAQGNHKSFAIGHIDDAGEGAAEEALWSALQGGLNIAVANFDEFLASVDEERAANARFFGGGN